MQTSDEEPLLGFEYYLPMRLLFGMGKLESISTFPIPGKKALVVISGGDSAREFDYLVQLTSHLERAGKAFSVFSGTALFPSAQSIMEGAAMARSEGADLVVALGGGTTLDTAKGIAFMASNEGSLSNYALSGAPLHRGALPLIAIPTTSGSGSECNSSLVYFDEVLNRRVLFSDPSLMPWLTLIDSELMISVPPRLTAFQGLQAFLRAIESYLSKKASPLSTLYAERSISLLYDQLPKAIRNGADPEHRSQVALASLYSGMAASLTESMSQQALAFALGSISKALPHSVALLMITEAYLTHFADLAEARFASLTDLLPMKRDSSQEKERAFLFVKILHKLLVSCGVADLNMSEFSIGQPHLEQTVALARSSFPKFFENDPAEVSESELLDILRFSYR